MLALGDLCGDVGYDAAVELGVVRHSTVCDHVGCLLLGITEYHRIAAGHDDLGGVIENDRVTDQNRLIAIDASLLSVEQESMRLRVEDRSVTLIPGGGITLALHQGGHNGISLVPLDQLPALRRIGLGAVAARALRPGSNRIANLRGERR